MTDKNRNPFVVEVESSSPPVSKPASPPVSKPAVVSERASKPEKPVISFGLIEPEQVSAKSNEEPASPVKDVIKPVEPVRQSPSPTTFEPELKRSEIQWGMFGAGVVTTLIVCGLAGGAWWGYTKRVALPPVSASPTPMAVAATPSTVVKPSPQPIVWSRNGIKVDVLNGTGVAGKAGTIATKIVGLGYSKGTTGNADKQKGSTLSFSSDIASFSAQIVSDIKPVAGDVTVSDKPLKGSKLIQLIIGE